VAKLALLLDPPVADLNLREQLGYLWTYFPIVPDRVGAGRLQQLAIPTFSYFFKYGKCNIVHP